MLRFQVTRRDVYYKGKRYITGDFLPENFSERDRIRHLYPSRIAAVNIPDPITPPESNKEASEPEKENPSEIIGKDDDSSTKGVEPAAETKSVNAPISGTLRPPLRPIAKTITH